MQSRSLVTWLAAICLPFGNKLKATEYIFETISAPNGDETLIHGINDLGHFVGEYGVVEFENPNSRIGNTGFVFDGEFRDLLPEGAISSTATGINNRGDIVGTYIDDTNRVTAFLYREGSFHDIDFPSAATTAPLDINDDGTIVGAFSFETVAPDIPSIEIHGFIYDEGEFSQFDFDGANKTRLNSINNAGDIAGSWTSPDGVSGGFVQPSGVKLTHPEATRITLEVAEITDAKKVYGNTMDIMGLIDFFNVDARFGAYEFDLATASYADVELPGPDCLFRLSVLEDLAPSQCVSALEGVNSHGVLAGYFDNDDGQFHGFIGTPVSDQGDFDNDGSLTAADIDLLTLEILSENPNPEFDLNSDALVDLKDRLFWIESIKQSFVGDSNLDGEFNSSDLIEVFQATEYEDGIPLNSTWETGDWNGDREFDSSDFVRAFERGGYETGKRASVATPEPSFLVAFRLAIVLCSSVYPDSIWGFISRIIFFFAAWPQQPSGLADRLHSKTLRDAVSTG